MWINQRKIITLAVTWLHHRDGRTTSAWSLLHLYLAFQNCAMLVLTFFATRPGKGAPNDKDGIIQIRHVRYSEVLKISARRGCRLCTLLLNDIKNVDWAPDPAMPSIIALLCFMSRGKVDTKLSFMVDTKLSFTRMNVSSWRFRLLMSPAEGQPVSTGSFVL